MQHTSCALSILLYAAFVSLKYNSSAFTPHLARRLQAVRDPLLAALVNWDPHELAPADADDGGQDKHRFGVEGVSGLQIGGVLGEAQHKLGERRCEKGAAVEVALEYQSRM